MPQATADLAFSVLTSKHGNRDKFERAGYVPTADDRELAAKALEWARAKFSAIPAEKRSDFEHNMYVATKATVVTRKTMGTAAYCVAAYLKEQDRLFKAKLEAERGVNSVHVGVVGESLMAKALTIIETDERDGEYGTTYKYKLMDAAGNQLVWWASSPIKFDVPEDTQNPECWNDEGKPARKAKQGDVVNLFGKVKSHGIFNNVKETTLTRCKVLGDAEIAEVEAKEAKKAAAAAKKAAKLAAKE